MYTRRSEFGVQEFQKDWSRVRQIKRLLQENKMADKKKNTGRQAVCTLR